MIKYYSNFNKKKFVNIINVLSEIKNPNKIRNNKFYKQGIIQGNKLKKNLEIKNYQVFKFKGADNQLQKKIIILSNLLGRLVAQNINKEKYIVIEPNLKLLQKYNNISNNKIRYHQTNKGGSIHTDGPQLNQAPNLIVMGCIKSSSSGGKTILVDSRKLFKSILDYDENILNILKNKFLFERRGFSDNKKMLNKKIFEIKKDKFEFRYLREYINSAYKISNTKISEDKIKALDTLDEFLDKKSLQKKLKLETGDVIIINNKITAHGRTGFAISKNKPRKLLRVWIK